MARAARDAVVIVHPGPGETGGSGAGFLFSSQGHILTNAHVVDDITGVEVILFDGRKLRARLVGMVDNQRPDVAVLKIEAETPLPTLDFGEPLEMGDTVVALGHPYMAPSGWPYRERW